MIARVQWVYSYSAGTSSAAPPPRTPATSLQPRVILTPAITMWNPYNLELTVGQLQCNIPKPLPAALKYKIGSTQYLKFNTLTGGGIQVGNPEDPDTLSIPNTLSTRTRIPYETNGSLTLLPGETKIFSPASANPINGEDRGTDDRDLVEVILAPGYRSGGGHYFTLKADSKKLIYALPANQISMEVVFNTTYNDAPSGQVKEDVGIFLDMRLSGQNHLAYRMIYEPEVASAVYPPLGGLAGSNPLENLVTIPSPFLTTIFGARMASTTHIPAKGFIQSSPLVNYTAMGKKDETESTIGRHYRSTSHPVNSPFDYSFAISTGSDSLSPQASAGTNRGFIVTGFGKDDGLSRCVIAELPTRPLQSLGELQNWDLRYENPIPPFAFNLIGNSSATPLIGANSVITDYDDPKNLQHDDSYCANHVPFDDWFFSSIAPNPANFGNNGKDLQTVYTDFINDTAKLPNSAYRPITADAEGDANDLFTEHVDTPDSWKTIASRLEVGGMFNVNSTSETAWRAILGHARGKKVPYLSPSGGGMSVSLSGETDYATSRFSVAGDEDTDSVGSSGEFENANQFTGYRVFTEAQINALARETVKQVRLRGPFLSLSEFVNRQLSSAPRSPVLSKAPSSRSRPEAEPARIRKSPPPSHVIRRPRTQRATARNTRSARLLTANLFSAFPAGHARRTSSARWLPYSPCAMIHSPSEPTVTPATRITTSPQWQCAKPPSAALATT